MPLNDSFHALRTFPSDKKKHYFSLPELAKQGMPNINRLPISIRIILEALLRNCDGEKVTEEDVRNLASWSPSIKQEGDVPFIVSRVILQDFTGVPLLVDLAAMRDAVAKHKMDPKVIEPEVPVDLVIDHSVQVDRSGTEDSFAFNLELEFDRNQERYSFLKWGQQAFKTFKVVPPGIGIVHQVNLEHIADLVSERKINDHIVLFPDTLVGTDSHTTMINGLGVVGWGVGGIEAEVGMLGEPVALQFPEVIGVCLEGKLSEGVTATDLTLRITEMLRKEKVVGKFVEFFGEGTETLSVADRAMIGNMCPEYGATLAFFPVDDKTLDYLKMTGRREEKIQLIKEYLSLQELFGIPKKGQIDYTKVLTLHLNTIKPCVAGPKRPQDRIELSQLKAKFQSLLTAAVEQGGYDKKDLSPNIGIHAEGTVKLEIPADSGGTQQEQWNPYQRNEVEMVLNRPFTHAIADPGYIQGVKCDLILQHGSIVIAAITSCTNTSNPQVMIGAGLLAKKAVERGLKVNPMIKTSLAPGSRIVTDYLNKAGLQTYLDQLGFHLVAYGCTTCIGNSGPLDTRIEEAIKDHDIIAASVLSGNRNFEARIHGAVKANFLMSPPLVVAFAIAGRIDFDMEKEPLGKDSKGNPLFLKDIWPTTEEIEDVIRKCVEPEMFKKRYANLLSDNPLWPQVKTSEGAQYRWDSRSTYIQNPPYFNHFSMSKQEKPSLANMRALATFGDSVTTDHISPAGSFRADSPAGKYLLSLGVKEDDFNSYGSRRGNHEVMMRGTFANVRIRNKIANGKEGGYTKFFPEGRLMTIFEASQEYQKQGVPLIVFAGKDYGMGSSRDWAAKGPALLGVRAVVAKSFERIHRSNLIGMGILPLEFIEGEDDDSLGIKGDELFSLLGLEEGVKPHQQVILEIAKGKERRQVKLNARIDTPIEAEYYLQGGIMPYVLRKTRK